MTKPGRKSPESLLVVPAALPQRPEPPADLPPEQADQWREIVAPMPVDWFTSETWPVLRQLCQHIATSRFVAAELSQFEGGYRAIRSKRNCSRNWPSGRSERATPSCGCRQSCA